MPEVITYPEGTAMSEDGKYRYLLVRRLVAVPSEAQLTVTFIMLNPSTADHTIDDPTIRRCKGFALGWGYTRMVVVNLFAYRATDPYGLIHAGEDIIGPRNAEYVRHGMEMGDMVVAAWGNYIVNAPFLGRKARPIIDLIHSTRETFCLNITKGGQPSHPLYIKGATRPSHFCTRSA